MNLLFMIILKLSVCLIITLLVLYRRLIRSWCRSVLFTMQLDAPKGFPLFGKRFDVTKKSEIESWEPKLHKKYSPFYKGWMGIWPVVTIVEPKYIQLILNSSKASEKHLFYSFIKFAIGDGLVTINGNKWKSHRRNISYYFNTNFLEHFVIAFGDCTNEHIRNTKARDEIKITTFTTNVVSTIAHNTILGIPFTEQAEIKSSPFSIPDKNRTYLKYLIWLLVNFVNKLTNRRLLCDRSPRREFAQKILEQRKCDLQQNKQLGWCLLDGFIEIQEREPDFNDDEVIDELQTFMLAGQDTLSGAIAYTLYFLAKDEEVQNKLFKEINETITNCTLTLNDLNKLTYLDRCIQESLRLVSVIPIIGRKLQQDVKLDEYIIPEGANILIALSAVHSSPEYFTHPDMFSPDRFCNEIDTNTFLPFSAGPRNCIGKAFAILEMKTIIIRLLQNYKVLLVPEKTDLNLTYAIVLRAKGGIMLRLQKR